jgi:hypothetical protein
VDPRQSANHQIRWWPQFLVAQTQTAQREAATQIKPSKSCSNNKYHQQHGLHHSSDMINMYDYIYSMFATLALEEHAN